MNRTSQQSGTPTGAEAKLSIGTLRVLVTFAAGVLTFCIVGLVHPRSFEPLAPADPNAFVDRNAFVIFNLAVHVSNFLNSVYVVPLLFLVWTYLAITKRDQPKSWIFAFLAGLAIPLIIFRWIFRWI
jgi:hypothetical protein